MEEIERAWFYDDSVTPTKVLVRAEERAVLRKGPRRQKKQREGESEEEGLGLVEMGSDTENGDSKDSEDAPMIQILVYSPPKVALKSILIRMGNPTVVSPPSSLKKIKSGCRRNLLRLC